MFKYNKYDVIFGEFPDMEGSVQSGYRPGIVIQNDIGNRYSPTLIVMPLTSKSKNLEQATHLLIERDEENGLKSDSILLAEQIATIDKRKTKKIGHISDRKLGIYHKSPHKIRKTYGTIPFDNHIDNKLIIGQMGYTDISCTENHYHRNRRSIDTKSRIISNIPEFQIKKDQTNV